MRAAPDEHTRARPARAESRAATHALHRAARGPQFARDWRGGTLLIGLALLALAPGLFSIPPIDRDEPRFAQASRQMARADSWRALIVPRVGDEPRLRKPPLIYWLQALSARLIGERTPAAIAEWFAKLGQVAPTADANPAAASNAAPRRVPPSGIGVYRLPSLLLALGSVLLTWRLGCGLFDPRVGLLAAALLAVCPVLLWDARLARADQLVLLLTIVAQLCLLRLWRQSRREQPARRDGRWAWWGFWLANALSLMTKGPITLGLTLLSAAFLAHVTRDGRLWRRLRVGGGLGIVALLTLPWTIAAAGEVGAARIVSSTAQEVGLRMILPQESHAGPPGYHALLLHVLFWPGAMLIVAGLIRVAANGIRFSPTAARQTDGRFARLQATWAARRPGRRADLFLLACIVPGWLCFELMRTKLPHYTLPLYPALALLAARATFAACSGRLALRDIRLTRFWLGLWVGIGAILTVAAPLTLASLSGLQGRSALAVLILAGACLLLLSVVAHALTWHAYLRAQVGALAAACFAALSIFGVTLPRVATPWPFAQAWAAIREHDPAGRRAVASIGPFEDSLFFLLDARVQRVQPEQLADWFADHPDGLVLYAHRAPLDQDSQAPLRELAQINGFNFSNGSWTMLLLAERAAARSP